MIWKAKNQAKGRSAALRGAPRRGADRLNAALPFPRGESGREGEAPRRAAGREGASACSGGWVAGAEMPFPWFKAPACGENFPADAGAQRGAQRGAPRRGAARPDIATSRHARTVDREGEREPLRPAAKRGSAPACNDR